MLSCLHLGLPYAIPWSVCVHHSLLIHVFRGRQLEGLSLLPPQTARWWAISRVPPTPVTRAPVNFSVWIGPDRPPSQDLHMTQTLASVFCWTPSRSRCIRTPPILCLGSLKSPMEVEPCKGPNSYFGSSTTSELRGLLRASLISLVQ